MNLQRFFLFVNMISLPGVYEEIKPSHTQYFFEGLGTKNYYFFFLEYQKKYFLCLYSFIVYYTLIFTRFFFQLFFSDFSYSKELHILLYFNLTIRK